MNRAEALFGLSVTLVPLFRSQGDEEGASGEERYLYFGATLNSPLCTLVCAFV